MNVEAFKNRIKPFASTFFCSIFKKPENANNQAQRKKDSPILSELNPIQVGVKPAFGQ